MSRPIPEGGKPPDGCAKFYKVTRVGALEYIANVSEDEWARWEEKTLIEHQSDKDALIRELVGALHFYSEEWQHGAEGWEPTEDLREDQGQEANRVLTLARTTCPEAFDGCYENSSS